MQLFYTYLITLGWTVLFHPFFITLTEIRHNPDNQRLEIAQKIFWDDLEVALSEFHEETVDFLNPENSEKLQRQVEEYLLKYNQVWLDGKEAKLRLLGYEIEEDAAWFYLESEPINWGSEIKVKNSILLENFDTQQNIIHIYKDSKSPRSMLLHREKESMTLRF